MSGAFAGELAVVVGFGVSGRAAAEALVAEGAEVRVTEARPSEQVATHLDASGPGDLALDAGSPHVEILGGGHRPEHLDGATLVVVSPGVPEGAPVIAWARSRGLPVWSELELGARLCRVPYVAVTGTNGKTTTVELLAAMMRAGGWSARACGNVGYPFSVAARDPAHTALAVEASSFQLAFHETLHPKVSVLLNLASDHLDWHGTAARYAAAKARIYVNQRDPDVHVGNRDDVEAARISRAAPCSVRWFGAAPAPDQAGPGIARRSSPGAARTFLLDAAAAAGAADAFGIGVDAIRSGIEGFTVLPHRGSVVAEAGSVRFVDDSKATNPHAALAALEGAANVVLIAGGLAKGVDLSPLAAAAPRLVAVVAIGEATPALAEVFRGLVPVHPAASMDEAVEAAYERARPGSTVLLAPACASQDMFRDYRDRGDRFAAAARAVAGRAGSHGSRVTGTEPPATAGRPHA